MHVVEGVRLQVRWVDSLPGGEIGGDEKVMVVGQGGGHGTRVMVGDISLRRVLEGYEGKTKIQK